MIEKLLKIEDLSRGGAGVARDEGVVVFVPLTAPGDEVIVRYDPKKSKKKNYHQGELVKIVHAAPLRVTAPCAFFARCGGCEWQHLPYSFQWERKIRGVRDAVARTWNLSQEALPVAFREIEAFPAQEPFHYRNRIQLRGARGILGYYARGSRDLVAIDHCWIADQRINAALAGIVGDSRLQAEEECKVEIEVFEDGQIRTHWNLPHGYGGFRQINDEQNAQLVRFLYQHVGSVDVLLDLYGGSGNLSLGLAGRIPEIHCVDLGAGRNHRTETPKGYFFHKRDVLSWLDWSRTHPKNRPSGEVTVFLDPPREGLGKNAKKIFSVLEDFWNAAQVFLVGCDVDSWARDTKSAVDRGWSVEKVAAIDFFPQTHHVECVAYLRRGNNAPHN